MVFHPSSKKVSAKQAIQYMIGDNDIEEVETVEYLRYIITKEL